MFFIEFKKNPKRKHRTSHKWMDCRRRCLCRKCLHKHSEVCNCRAENNCQHGHPETYNIVKKCENFKKY